MIVLKPLGGLCNRMRVISSAIRLGEKAGHSLRVVWLMDGEMNERFSSVFVSPKEFELIEPDDVRTFNDADKFEQGRSDFLASGDFKKADSRAEACDRICSSDRQVNWYMESCYQILDGVANYDWLRPVDSISEEIAEWSSRLGTEYVGVHIRRTDNVKSRRYSPDELFESAIRERLELAPSTMFFVASDDESVKKDLQERFPGRIVIRDKIVGRYGLGGLKDAVVDMFLLSKANEVWGSYWSSFSEEPAKIGGCKYIQIKRDPDRV